MIRVRYRFFYLLLVAFLMLAVNNAASAGSKQIQRGQALYLQYCVSCHGPTAQGDGPVAGALSTPPANLRRLAERFGNPLPEDQVARYIDGRAEVKAHGPRDMPVWGARFYTSQVLINAALNNGLGTWWLIFNRFRPRFVTLR